MNKELDKKEIVNIAFEIAIKLLVVSSVLFVSFMVVKPFIILVIWAIIIAVTLFPVVEKIEKKYKIKRSIVIFVITFGTILALIIPTYMLSGSLFDSSKTIATQVKNDTYEMPVIPKKIQSIPLVGKKLYKFLDDSSHNLKSTIKIYSNEIKGIAAKATSAIGSLLGTVFQFIISLLIAAFFLNKAEGCVSVYYAISNRIVGDHGEEWANLSAQTVRSIVQGVIGIAIIQATLALIGLLVMDVPLAGFWALLVMFLAIIQLPSIILLGPIVAYVLSYADTTPGLIFAAYMIFVSLSDNVLKPLLLGRGVDVPMLVVLLGAIGGMILFGVIGLFVGSVVLALAYKVFMVWLEEEA